MSFHLEERPELGRQLGVGIFFSPRRIATNYSCSRVGEIWPRSDESLTPLKLLTVFMSVMSKQLPSINSLSGRDSWCYDVILEATSP